MSFQESDIRPQKLLDEYLRLNAHDAKSLLTEIDAFIERPCPGCGGGNCPDAFVKNEFQLKRCAECDSLFVSPTPSEMQLNAFYRDSPSATFWATEFFPAVAEARRKLIFRPRAEQILARLSRLNFSPETAMDVGAGAGIFLQELSALRPHLKPAAIEPGAAFVESLKYASFPVFEGFAEQAATSEDWAGRWDLVTCFEVIEHVVQPEKLIRALCQLARPGGYVVLSGLCGTGFDILALGQHAKAVSPPHHLTFLSLKGAETASKRAGLGDVDVFTPGELDMDIVKNALAADPTIPVDPFIRRLVQTADRGAANAMQNILKEQGLSSHMWIIGRRSG